MRIATLQRLLGWSAACAAGAALMAAEPATRASPTRPSASKPAGADSRTAVATRKVPSPSNVRATAPAPARGNVPLTEVAARLGLKPAWTEPGRKVVLSDRQRRLVLEANSRECEINGTRVFLGDPVLVRRGQLLVSDIDFAACLVPLLKPSLIPPPRPSRPRVIALDPGHGGNDGGTSNTRLKLREKTFTLDVAQRLKRRLEDDGFKVVLTRETDTRIDLPSRAIIANQAKADLFVSIHFNALPNDQKTHGTEVFTFAPRHQRSTNAWGALERDDTERDLVPGNRHDAWNSLLAHVLHRQLLQSLKTFDRGKKIGHLGVLRGLNCPGVLVESGFLSHDEEARRIATPGYRQEIADALADGIAEYARQLERLKK